MKLLTAAFLLGCVVVAGVAVGRDYFQSPVVDHSVEPQGGSATQPNQINPNDIISGIPPLAPEPRPFHDRSNDRPLDHQTAAVSDTPALESPLPEVTEQSERQVIELADLEAAPEVLERRIANKVKSILDEIALPHARPAEDRREGGQGDSPGRISQ